MSNSCNDVCYSYAQRLFNYYAIRTEVKVFEWLNFSGGSEKYLPRLRSNKEGLLNSNKPDVE